MARFEHENKVRRKELKPEKNGMHLFLESGIHCAGIRNPVPPIRNPQHGIQNPRLSWIPLDGAIKCIMSIMLIECLVSSCKNNCKIYVNYIPYFRPSIYRLPRVIALPPPLLSLSLFLLCPPCQVLLESDPLLKLLS